MLNQLDLEDLVQMCRSAHAKAYVKEAVDCYRIGAYRACVITTWIALVYDIIDKLRELALLGDANATRKVQEFDQIQKDLDTEAALKFEKEVLVIAHKDFDLITPHEKSDLQRLYHDRNRCGHPNLNRETEVYTPPPELARLHLRVAIEHVLARPPVQGKVALAGLQQTVESEFFPTDIEKAEVLLRSSALPRTRPAVVSDFVIGGLLSCVREDLTEKQCAQRIAAVKVAERLHPQLVRTIFQDKFDNTFSKTRDSHLNKYLHLLVSYPDLQPYVAEATWTRLETFIQSLPSNQAVAVLSALRIKHLEAAALARIGQFGEEEMIQVVATVVEKPPYPIIERSLALYSDPPNFDTANTLAKKLILPLLPYFGNADAKALIHAGGDSQVRGSNQFPNVVSAIKKNGILTREEISQVVREAGLRQALPQFIVEEDEGPQGDDDIPF